MRSFELDEEFRLGFRFLKACVDNRKLDWAETIISFLIQHNALEERSVDPDLNLLRRLYKAHDTQFRCGRFDAAYLDTIEDIALFYIFHDLRSVWVAGAYNVMVGRLLDQLQTRAAMNKKIPLHQTSKLLVRVMSLEINQIQRCFTLYERHISQSLVRDLEYGGVITQTNPPTPSRRLQ